MDNQENNEQKGKWDSIKGTCTKYLPVGYFLLIWYLGKKTGAHLTNKFILNK